MLCTTSILLVKLKLKLMKTSKQQASSLNPTDDARGDDVMSVNGNSVSDINAAQQTVISRVNRSEIQSSKFEFIWPVGCCSK